MTTTRVSMLLKSRASPDMLPFSLCNIKRLAIQHMNRSLFPTTLSIPSYDIGKQIGLRTYQHPFVQVLPPVFSRMTVFWNMTPSSLVKVGLAVKVRVKQRGKRKTNGCAIQPLGNGSSKVRLLFYPEEAFTKMSVISQQRRASAKDRISGQSHSLHTLHQARCQTLALSVIAIGGTCCSVTQ